MAEPHESIVVGGIYRHYKGGLYRVVAISRNESTLEWQVTYRKDGSVDLDEDTWTRPVAEWIEIVYFEGHNQYRYRLILGGD